MSYVEPYEDSCTIFDQFDCRYLCERVVARIGDVIKLDRETFRIDTKYVEKLKTALGRDFYVEVNDNGNDVIITKVIDELRVSRNILRIRNFNEFVLLSTISEDYNDRGVESTSFDIFVITPKNYREFKDISLIVGSDGSANFALIQWCVKAHLFYSTPPWDAKKVIEVYREKQKPK